MSAGGGGLVGGADHSVAGGREDRALVEGDEFAAGALATGNVADDAGGADLGFAGGHEEAVDKAQMLMGEACG